MRLHDKLTIEQAFAKWAGPCVFRRDVTCILGEAAPHPYLLINPDFAIAGANKAYAEATLTHPDEIVGRHLFDVFPDNPAAPDANGVGNLTASLRTVIAERRPHHMEVQRYDIRNRNGQFVERYWIPANYPVLNDRTSEVDYLLHTVTDARERMKEKLILGEAVHRYKNLFAKIQMIIYRSSQTATSAEALATALQERIEAMDRTQLLSARAQSCVSLRRLVEDELEPYRALSNVYVEGADVALKPSAAQSFSMVLHELTSNALKYGGIVGVSRPRCRTLGRRAR